MKEIFLVLFGACLGAFVTQAANDYGSDVAFVVVCAALAGVIIALLATAEFPKAGKR